MGWYKQHSSFSENPFNKPVINIINWHGIILFCESLRGFFMLEKKIC